MNLKQALYVKTIAQEGGITAAAKKLYISQPSLSQMLRQIEEEVGLELFDRSRSPFRPTYAGERYLYAATVMLGAEERMRNELQEIRQEGSGRLRLGISVQRGARILPGVLPQFFRDFPHVALELREAGSAALVEMVRQGEVDVALASTVPSHPDLTYHLIQRETIGILAGRDSPLAAQVPSGEVIDLRQVAQGPFICMTPDHNSRVIQELLFRQENLHPQILLETDSMEIASRTTVTSAGYLICSDLYINPEDYFYPIKNYVNRHHFYACIPKGMQPPKYMRAFLELVEKRLGGEEC